MLFLRYGEVSKQIMVVLVVNSVQFPARRNFVNALVKKHSHKSQLLFKISILEKQVLYWEMRNVYYMEKVISKIHYVD